MKETIFRRLFPDRWQRKAARDFGYAIGQRQVEEADTGPDSLNAELYEMKDSGKLDGLDIREIMLGYYHGLIKTLQIKLGIIEK